MLIRLMKEEEKRSYLNDSFPSAPIDYRKVSANPYAAESFDYFVQAMRKELSWAPEN